MRLLVLVALVGCHGKSGDTGDDTDVTPPAPPAWDDAPAAIDCADGADAPLLDAALANAGTDRDGLALTHGELMKSPYKELLDDPFLLPWYRDLEAAPLTIPCFGATRALELDTWAGDGHPTTGAVRAAMEALGEPLPDAPFDPSTVPTFQDGLDAMIAVTGDDAVTADVSKLPDGLADALGPVLGAMSEVAFTWKGVRNAAPDDPELLSTRGHGDALIDLSGGLPDITKDDVQTWVLDDVTGPRALYGPTARLLQVLEDADLERFAGQGDEGVLLDVDTKMGRIVVAGPGADAPGEIDPVLLYVDLGGDDTYVHSAGANADGMPVSVMVDLGGNDVYGYTPDPDSRDGDRLVSDDGGRYKGDANYGPFSLSRHGRQGSGRFGVGVLLDDGGGNDQYTSLRMSQGWGHLGVGALYDDGGDDVYRGEAGVQGAASMGIGVLVDGGGTDDYETYANSQGFAYVQAAGILDDRGDGSDRYFADPGPQGGGDLLYYSPQMPGTANSSFAQGAGFGRRGDSDGVYLSGGFAMLHDGGGDDTYTAGLFAQGAGYWEGTGLLDDAAGDDTYDAFWYVQGAAAHYAIGVLLDGAGNDRLNPTLTPVNMHMGAGHDMSIGVYVDESGDDEYRYISLAAGASNCQGEGFFVDNDGTDAYTALSSYSTGLGNESTECNVGLQATADDIGIFLDSGGDEDTYVWPGDDGRTPANDSSFGRSTSGDDDEHGGAVDGDGETAMHAGGAIP